MEKFLPSSERIKLPNDLEKIAAVKKTQIEETDTTSPDMTCVT
jgi:hypothetical protein